MQKKPAMVGLYFKKLVFIVALLSAATYLFADSLIDFPNNSAETRLLWETASQEISILQKQQHKATITFENLRELQTSLQFLNHYGVPILSLTDRLFGVYWNFSSSEQAKALSLLALGHIQFGQGPSSSRDPRFYQTFLHFLENHSSSNDDIAREATQAAILKLNAYTRDVPDANINNVELAHAIRRILPKVHQDDRFGGLAPEHFMTLYDTLLRTKQNSVADCEPALNYLNEFYLYMQTLDKPGTSQTSFNGLLQRTSLLCQNTPLAESLYNFLKVIPANEKSSHTSVAILRLGPVTQHDLIIFLKTFLAFEYPELTSHPIMARALSPPSDLGERTYFEVRERLLEQLIGDPETQLLFEDTMLSVIVASKELADKNTRYLYKLVADQIEKLMNIAAAEQQRKVINIKHYKECGIALSI